MRTTITIGTITKHGDPVPNLRRMVADTAADLSRVHGGCTVTHGVGCWIDAADNLIEEDVVIFTVLSDKEWSVVPVAAALRDRFFQDAVAVDVSDSTFTLI